MYAAMASVILATLMAPARRQLWVHAIPSARFYNRIGRRKRCINYPTMRKYPGLRFVKLKISCPQTEIQLKLRNYYTTVTGESWIATQFT